MGFFIKRVNRFTIWVIRLDSNITAGPRISDILGWYQDPLSICKREEDPSFLSVIKGNLTFEFL